MKKYREEMNAHFAKMALLNNMLFRANIDGDDLWDFYLNSFKDDPIFRDPESSTHNCNHCNNFLRRYGNIIAIDENSNIITLFDFIPTSEEFIPVNKKLSEILKSVGIRDVFFETYEELNSLPYESIKRGQELYQLGIISNVKRYTKEEAELYPNTVEANQVVTFQHMGLMLPSQFVKKGEGSIEAISGKYRDARNVFYRSMEEIPLDTLLLVKDLINQGSLLDGATHLGTIENIIPFKETYDRLELTKRENWSWIASYNLPNAKWKNTLIGVLCSELAQGMELNKACQNWNKRVDPINYMKAKAPITQKQIKEAKIFVETEGYESAFNRRPATLDDIKASEILHLNSGDGNLQGVSIFDKVKATKPSRHNKSEFDGVEEVSIETFMKDILPGCTSIEAFVRNQHENNMVTLTTSVDDNSKNIFKWNNNYSWTYNGNLAGISQIREAVAKLGGKIDGYLRFSIMWAESIHDNSDLDAHCIESKGDHIYFSHMRSAATGGNLDIDVINPREHRKKSNNVVENITFPKLPEDQSFKFYVNNYSNRGSVGFKAEVEFDDQMFYYEYPHPLSQSENINVATVTLKDGRFSIKHHLDAMDGSSLDRNFYNIDSNRFHKVKLMCLSPNHWGSNKVGNKHYFFMLENAKSPMSYRSFHNENLKSDLVAHRKVMETLANTTMVEPSSEELTGLGFNATVRDELILRLKGSHKRVIKVKF